MVMAKERKPELKPVATREKKLDEQCNVSVRKGFEYSDMFTFTQESGPVGGHLISIRPSEGFFSPRHRHSETLVRYLVSGTMRYGNEEHFPGDCTIIPDSIYYGPMQPGSGELPHFLQATFAGRTGVPPMMPDVIAKARAALAETGEFKDGVYFPKEGGAPRDGYEAVAAHVYGEVEYPPPLLKDKVTVRSSELPWKPYAAGVDVKKIASLFDTGPHVTLLRLKKGATLPAGTSGWQQARWVVEGEVSWGEERYGAISMLYYPPSVAYPSTTALSDCVLFSLQWTTELEEPPSTLGGAVF